MKHIKIYEDYSDEELDDLLGDLVSVGHGKKVKVVCLVEGSDPQQLTHPSWWTEYMEVFAITVFPDRGTENANKEFALQKIRRGEFEQSLETDEPRVAKKAGPEILSIVDKGNIQRIASGVPTLYALLQEVKNEIVQVLIKKWEGINSKSLAAMSDLALQEFYKTEWRSSPKKVRETIDKSLKAEIRVRGIE
jgi:hypothetical protein